MSYLETEFDYRDLKCVVSLNPRGFRCGYVGIPKNNKYYGMDYMKIEESIDDLSVHGGITYGSFDMPVYAINGNNLYWIGFDCKHFTDAIDIEIVKKLNPHCIEMLEQNGIESILTLQNERFATIKTKEFVIENCKILADALLDN